MPHPWPIRRNSGASRASACTGSSPIRRSRTSAITGDVHIRWYYDGTLNVSANCLDRHLATRADDTAIIWEGDSPSEQKHISYGEAYERVCRMANVLKARGIKKGDRVTIYMPMIPEAAYAMLACARIGAVHSVVFGGFSPESLVGRIQDCDSNCIITADEGLRGGRKIPLKRNVDEALARCPSVKTCLVVRRTGGQIAWVEGRDVWYHEAMTKVDRRLPAGGDERGGSAVHPLHLRLDGQTQGRAAYHGGYLVYVAYTHQNVFDYHDGDIYWCTADVGWVTGHSYIVYGPLANGATTLMFEGVPNYPDSSRFWQVIDKHKVNIFYTAPTAIRALMREGEEPVKRTSRKSLRLLGSVGEPINPEAWLWYYNVVGDGRCPIVDTWWQTETGGILISPLPGATALKPGSATLPLPGIKPVHRRCRRQGAGGRGHGQSLHRRFLAGPDAHGLWRPQALRRNLFLRLSRHVFHRRRLPARQGRLLLDHRARRRCDQRLRPSHGHGGSRERAGRQ